MKDLKFVSGAVWTLRAARLAMRPPGRAARVPEGVLTPSPTTATASASSAPPVGSPSSPLSKEASVPRHQLQEGHRQVRLILTYLWLLSITIISPFLLKGSTIGRCEASIYVKDFLWLQLFLLSLNLRRVYQNFVAVNFESYKVTYDMTQKAEHIPHPLQ